MPLNDLLRRHQLSLMRAAAAAPGEAQRAHRASAAGYADRVAALAESAGATAAPLVRA